MLQPVTLDVTACDTRCYSPWRGTAAGACGPRGTAARPVTADSAVDSDSATTRNPRSGVMTVQVRSGVATVQVRSKGKTVYCLGTPES